jgi:hypothetical protein
MNGSCDVSRPHCHPDDPSPRFSDVQQSDTQADMPRRSYSVVRMDNGIRINYARMENINISRVSNSCMDFDSKR